MFPCVRIALPVLLGLLSVAAFAHGDEEHAHDESAATASMPAANSGGTRRVAVLSSELYEAVVEPHGDHIAIWLDRYDSNAPVTGAKIEVTLDERAAIVADEESPGLYEFDAPADLDADHDVAVQLVISAPEGDDLLGGTLAGDPDHHEHGTSLSRRWLLALGAALAAVAAAVVGFVAWRRRARAAVAALLLFSAGTFAQVDAARAHEGHDHAEEAPPAPVTGSRPLRAADGSVFLPKATQRVLDVRTAITTEGPAPVSIKLVGEISGDPRASAALQTLQGGRVGATARGWPELGARVRRGQPLLQLTPSGSGAERAGATAEKARTEAELAQAKLELARLEGLPGVVARAEVDAARARVASLEAQRNAWRATGGGGEVIVSPIDGVIAALHVRPGEVAEPGIDLVSIVDPARLGVEALAFEPVDRSRVQRASVALRDGTNIEAELAGVGATQSGGALPVQLRLRGTAPGLSVGQPVTAWLEQTAVAQGIVLPAAAIVRLGNGETVVFEKIDAERYMPRTVRIRPISGERVAVLAGLRAGTRVVVQGAGLIAQVR